MQPCTEYCFRVHAINDSVSGQSTDELNVFTNGSRPDNPAKPHVSPSDVDPVKALVTIQKLGKEKENGAPVTEIAIELSKDLKTWKEIGKECVKGNVKEVYTIATELPKLSVIEGDKFFFQVKMRNKFGQSGPSETVSLPFAVLRPGKVQELQQTCTTTHGVKLKWKAPVIHCALVSSYVIQRKVPHDDSTAWKEELLLDSNKDENIIIANISDLPMNVECDFRVIPKNKDVNGHYSEISVQTPEMYPGHPINLREDKI